MARIGGWAAGVSLAVLAACSAGSASAQDDKVGVTAAVNPQATGTPPQRAMRTLSVGLDMIRNEHIVTGPEGKTQLLFVDGSALTIGPNADLVLDEFVYDPNTGTGKLAMTATKGVFRVVGGKISKSEGGVTLKTPTATLGIRGGIATAEVGAGGFFGFLFGQKMTVDGTGNDGQPVQQVVTRPGTGVPLGPNGTVGSPIPIPPEKLQAAMQALEGDTGKNGGAREQPTDARVATTDLAALGSGLPPEVVGAEPAAGGDGAPGPGLPGTPNTSTFSQTLVQNNLSGPSTGSDGTPLTLTGNLAGRYKSTPGSGSAAGTAGDGGSFFDSAFTGGGFLGNMFTASTGVGSFSAPVNPAGGFLSYGDGEASSPFGPISGTSFVSVDRDFVFFESIETDFVDERSFLFAGMATPVAAIPTDGFAAYDIRRDFVGGTNIPFIPAALGGNLSGTVSPAFVGFNAFGGNRPFVQASIAFNGSGDTQSSVVSILLGQLGPSGGLNLIGSMRGSSRLGGDYANFFNGPVGFSLDGNGNGVFGTSGPDYFVLESRADGARGVTTSDVNFLSGTYFPNNVASRIPGFVVGSRTSTPTMLGVLNGITTTEFLGDRSIEVIEASFPGSFALVTTPALNSVFAVAAVNTPSTDGYTLAFGDGMSVGGRSAYIDDRRFAAIESDVPSTAEQDGPSVDMPNVRLYLVSGGLTDAASLLPPGVSPCDCDFMRWGFWGGDFTNSISGQRERVHLGQWVAGDLASAGEIAGISGIGTYSGHAIADIANGGRVYKAGGGFSMTYDFAMRSGTANVTALDGINYTAGVSASSGIEHLPSGTLSGVGGGGIGSVSGPLNLGFYRNGANPAGGVGGGFNVGNGEGYSATGIVIGRQTNLGPGA